MIWLEYLVVAYIGVGAAVYIYGHPRIFKSMKIRLLENEDIDKTSMTASRGLVSRYSAHAAQGFNFLTHRIVTALTRPYPKTKHDSIEDAYRIAAERAFKKSNFFITTGAPHSRALFLRNFAWFYPTLLDPRNILDQADADRRLAILERSISVVLQSTGSMPYTTTLVPLSPNKLAAVNYVKEPSDSLLGILTGIEMMVDADPGMSPAFSKTMHEAREKGLWLLHKNNEQLRDQVYHLIRSLKPISYQGVETLLIDRDDSRSSATDTRLERRRFVANANAWSTFDRAIELKLIEEEELSSALGRSLEDYKSELLSVFGKSGVITNSLDDHKSGADSIVLDFAHIHNGFWKFSNEREIGLFLNTADAVIKDPKFRDNSGKCFLISAANPKIRMFQHFAATSYHGRTTWPTFNAAFAERIIDLSERTGRRYYMEVVLAILGQIEAYILSNRGYPEVLNPNGKPYSTWGYRSAEANSWFPYFMSVRERAKVYYQ